MGIVKTENSTCVKIHVRKIVPLDGGGSVSHRAPSVAGLVIGSHFNLFSRAYAGAEETVSRKARNGIR